jgi:hypothetical protein
MGSSQQRAEWENALRNHARQMEDLSRQVAQLDAGCPSTADCPCDGVRRQIEYANAQVIRHQIRMALLTSRLAVSGGEAP